MKRRNADSTKFRKQFHFRKCKFAEGVYGSSTFLYLKFLFIWLLIMIADFLLEFRFEFLWPFWLVIRSLHDSFKYQGIIFSLFFALITFFSDLLCYMFLPVQWLFFAASTYVWVQYVWHTEKGICLPTISLWLLFVYIEASLRLKTLKTIDLCRPFAAHCIGYPMVTLGFGFKSYLSYKLRLKKQKEIQKLNEFYMQLIAKALPLELQLKDKEKFKALNYEEEISSQQVLSVSPTSQSSSILASICNIGSNSNSLSQSQQTTNNSNSMAAFVNTKENTKNSKSNNGILATALSFYLNGSNSSNSSSANTNNSNTNSNSSQQISNNTTQIEDLPYIQQKDITNIINKTININNNNNNYNSKQQQQQQQQTFNKSNSFSNYNSQNFSKKQQQQQQQQQATQSQPQLDNENQSVNCNLSSFSIASVAYSTEQSSTTGSNSNLLVLNQKLDGGNGTNGTENTNTNSSTHRSASSSATSSTNAFLPSQSSTNHTNININMTINATAIAAATATATANAPNTTNNNNNNNNTNQTALAKTTGSNGKKFKNKDSNTQRANSVSSSASSNSSNLANGQAQQSNAAGSQATLNNDYGYKDETINKLEEDLKKLKLEIQQQKSVEQYLRNQINYITKCDRTEKLKLERLQQENKTLQTKLNKSSTQSQKDKDEIDSLEKKFQDEKQLRTSLETQLSQEKKLKDDLQSKLKQYSQFNNECSTDYCKTKLKEMESENKKLVEENKLKQERIMMLECEIKSLAKYRDNESRVDTLMVALNLMEDKNTSLQESLSAETRFKLDLFSALGETRRQLEAVNFQLKAKERELNALKTILKQSLTNGTSSPSSSSSTTTASTSPTPTPNGTSDTLNFNLNDVISQLNSANLLNMLPTSAGLANGLHGSASCNQLSFAASQQPQPSPSPPNAQSSTNYLPKI